MIPKATYYFSFARKGLDSKGRGLVQLVVYIDRARRIYRSTKYRLLPSQWDVSHGCVRVTDQNTALIDQDLKDIIRRIEAWELDLIRRGDHATPDKVREFLDTAAADTLNRFIQAEIDRDLRLRPGTVKMHRMMLRKLSAMQPEITFMEIGYDLVVKFDNYLRSLGLGTNTIADNHKLLRRYIYIAIKRNLISSDQNPYRSKFRPQRVNVARVYLSGEELCQLEGLDLSESLKLSRVKDMFLFCCYTGLRFSDLMALRKDHIQQTAEGYELALHQMVKVPAPVFIPLHLLFDGKAQAILVRYLPKSGLVFPRISNQKANEYIKIVCQLAGIHKPVTWHTARHTCASLLAARYNDPFVIMQILGHSEIKTSMIYIHSSREILKDKLRR